MTMKKAYARISTTAQNIDSQLDELKSYGYDEIYIDEASGKRLSNKSFGFATQVIWAYFIQKHIEYKNDTESYFSHSDPSLYLKLRISRVLSKAQIFF